MLSMSPATSDYLGPRAEGGHGSLVDVYVDMCLNPWGGSMARLPDAMIAPTFLFKSFANRTYTVTNVATYGPNILFGMMNRPTRYLPATTPAVAGGALEAAIVLPTATTLSTPFSQVPTEVAGVYAVGSPGQILAPMQYGATPLTAMVPLGTTGLTASDGPWKDDFGEQMDATVGAISAYRTLAMAMRMRIVGLPSGQFMTPGKIYIAQGRWDKEDVPLTEQDFVVLEQKGRASHVSADAVRAAGSKTLFYTPDGMQKFGMTSNFLPAPGVFDATRINPGGGGTYGSSYAGLRVFPGIAQMGAVPALGSMVGPLTFDELLVPYGTAAAVTGRQALGNAADSANADSTSLLWVAYFGAQDGVVLEVDYAHIMECTPNKSAPPGFEAAIQLPNSAAMDSILSACAVLAMAKPRMYQSAGDPTVSIPAGTSRPSAEALSVRRQITSVARVAPGRAMPIAEGFWDFSWLKKAAFGDQGKKGGGGISWDFSGK